MTAIERHVPESLEPLLAPARFKAAWGGRASGKSHFFAEECVLRMYQSEVRIAGIREVQSSIRESVRQLMIDKIEQFGLNSFFTVLDAEIRGANGSIMIFKGMQSYNAANIKSLEGYDIAWVEEAQTLSHLSFRLLRPTIRKEGSQLFFSWNPRFKTDAVDEFFRGPDCPDNAIVVRSTYKDNPFLTETIKDEIARDYLADPAMADHVWGGGYEVITKGTYYGPQMAIAEKTNRITSVPHDVSADTYAAWDLGIGDNMAIWIFQKVGREYHFVNFYTNRGYGLEHYVDWVKSLPYHVNQHLVPHDARARELQTGQSRLEFLEKRGFRVTIVPNHKIDDGINAVRNKFSAFWFDRDHCEEGLDCLRKYRAEFDETHGVQKTKPLHDSASHGADAFRYAIMGQLAHFNDNWAGGKAHYYVEQVNDPLEFV
jgi:phage terminase large subunit